MSKKAVKEIADLPYYKPEHSDVLKEMDITTLSQLFEALTDERYDVIVGKHLLKGIGQKHAEHWIEVIEDSMAEAKAEEPVPGTALVPAEPKAKKVARVEEPETEIVEAPVEIKEEGAYRAEPKAQLDAKTKDLLKKRAEIDDRRPAFRRQEWFRFSRLGEKWRKPRGIHSKMRRHYGYRPPIVSIGYGGPAEVRGYHPSGFKEVMVHNVDQLTGVDPRTEAVRIGGTVGRKKKLTIEAKANELGIRVLNRTG